jgi:hypothetical protein
MTIRMAGEVAYAAHVSDTIHAQKPLGSAGCRHLAKQSFRTAIPPKASVFNNFIDQAEDALLAVVVGSAVSCATRHA